MRIESCFINATDCTESEALEDDDSTICWSELPSIPAVGTDLAYGNKFYTIANTRLELRLTAKARVLVFVEEKP